GLVRYTGVGLPPDLFVMLPGAVFGPPGVGGADGSVGHWVFSSSKYRRTDFRSASTPCMNRFTSRVAFGTGTSWSTWVGVMPSLNGGFVAAGVLTGHVSHSGLLN